MRGRIVYGAKRRYFLDDTEVSAADFHAALPSRLDGCRDDDGCITCVPGMHHDYGDWRNEKTRLRDGTVRDGRYCPQAARYPGDPKAVFDHRESLVDWAERQGKTVER